jgi:type II secretory pathway component PulF
MPTFTYKAMAADGSEIQGDIDAESKAAAIQRLSQNGYAVYDVFLGNQISPERWYNRQLFQRTQHSDGDLAELSRGLSTLLHQHLTLDQALGILANASSRRSVSVTLRQVLRLLQSGETPQRAFATVSNAFPNEFLVLVGSGAKSNALSSAFDAAAQYYQRRQRLKQKIISAVAYPTFLILAAALVFVIILQTMVPALYDTLVSSGRDPSLSIQTLHQLSGVMSSYWQIILVVFALLILCLVVYRRSIRQIIARILPPLRKHAAEGSFARCARQLSMLLTAGETLDGAVSSILDGSEGELFHEPMFEAQALIRSGQSAMAALHAEIWIPSAFTQLFELGEKTNNLTTLLGVAAQTLEETYERRTQRLTGFMTPLLTLFVGGLIAFLVQILMTAVLEVSQVAV